MRRINERREVLYSLLRTPSKYKWYVSHLDEKYQHEAGRRAKWLGGYTILTEWLTTINNSIAGESNVSGLLGHWHSHAHTYIHNSK